jgi:hypothetical protein
MWQSDVVPKGDKSAANSVCPEIIFARTPDGEHFLTGES